MYKLTHSARIPHYKPHGKNVYFLREELEQWLSQNPVRIAEQKNREATEFVLRKRRPR
ncbi:helix-turn-helix domain-containing protein [uncultured Alistipes sp.]|uniref:helix-turn-helix domain-containing protein n=1 Tax=uncultured Alistipes sp. TaxID=538949 RepID=UPI0028040229|nr:helix-turn-helix domain-containing protein [uncultured Alistipes sp.]